MYICIYMFFPCLNHVEIHTAKLQLKLSLIVEIHTYLLCIHLDNQMTLYIYI